uniref:Transcriptional regulator n=1 Tax=Desulfovibrio sp. U5L TaxID=596152 RepID=I2Q4A1_9BACT
MSPKHTRATTSGRRQDILRAALACFAERGFSRTTMADIRRRSKSSTGSVYHLFKSKEDLAAALYLEGIADYQAGWITALEARTDAREGLQAVVAYCLEWVAQNEDWARYLFGQCRTTLSPAAEEELRAANEKFLGRAARWFAARVEAGQLRPLPPDITTALIAGPYLEFMRQILSGRTETPRNKAANLLAEGTWRALAARHENPPPEGP